MADTPKQKPPLETSYGDSTLSMPVYVVRRKSEAMCFECKRSPIFYEGCSLIECPMRKPITAQPKNYRPPKTEEKDSNENE